jgi:tetratricopeptide (TPR) repeat protein
MATTQSYRQEAGALLFEACEEALRVSGPRALGRRLGRSTAWWSRLRRGESRLPEWSELANLLPSDLSAGEKETLRERHRMAWLLACDPELIDDRAAQSAMVPVEELRRTWEYARLGGYYRYENREALTLVTIVERLLTARSPDSLSPAELDLLTDCLEDRSVYEANLGDYPAAIAAARRAANYQRLAGNSEAERHCLHSAGIAYFRASRYYNALEVFAPLKSSYERTGDQSELVRVLRDIGATYTWMRRHSEGEQWLEQALSEAANLPLSEQYPTVLWLADVNKTWRRLERARFWLARVDDLARRHGQELAGMLSLHYMRDHREQVEMQVAKLERHRRRERC